MAPARSAVIRDRARRDAVHPRSEALFLGEIRDAAVYSDEGVLQDIVDVRRRSHAARDVRPRDFDEEHRRCLRTPSSSCIAASPSPASIERGCTVGGTSRITASAGSAACDRRIRQAAATDETSRWRSAIALFVARPRPTRPSRSRSGLTGRLGNCRASASRRCGSAAGDSRSTSNTAGQRHRWWLACACGCGSPHGFLTDRRPVTQG